jgi:outer membrane protein assembly factor BamB
VLRTAAGLAETEAVMGAGRSVVAGVSLVLAAGLAVGGCGSSSPGTPACTARSAGARGVSAAGGSAPPATAGNAANPAVAPGWRLPGGNLANTRDVASVINSSNVSQLGVAWTVPLRISTAHNDGAYATTPVLVNGVVYVQDLESNVMAISLATGKVLWRHTYSSPNGGPDGVNVAHGVVYAATNHAAVALSAATGRQLWSRTLIGNNHEGMAGILIELNAQTGKLIWKLPVGLRNGHEHAGLLSEHAKPTSHLKLPNQICLEPGVFGGVLTQLASNGSTTFAAVNDLPVGLNGTGAKESTAAVTAVIGAILAAPGEMVAVNQDTGKIEWDTKLPSSPYGAATVTNNVVFTTTFHGDLYALNAATGAILLRTPMSAGANAPVAIDGDYVIAGAGTPFSAKQRPMIIAYKLGATGKLPDTVSS